MTVSSAAQSGVTEQVSGLLVDVAPYLRDGFAIYRDVIPHDVLDRMISAIERHLDVLAREAHARGDIADLHEDLDFEHRLLPIIEERVLDQRCFDPLRHSKEIGDIITHPVLVELLVPILGPEITYQGNAHVRACQPGPPRITPWHQDGQFYGRRTEVLRDHLTQVWLPLMDVDLQNGCLAMVPGSHREGLLGGDEADADVARSTPTHRGSQDRLRLAGQRAEAGPVVNVPMRKGDVVVFTSLTVHTGVENQSDRVRWSVDIRYESTLGSKPLTAVIRDAFAVYHRGVPGGGRIPLRVRSAKGGERWEDWLRRQQELQPGPS